jgi:DNA (cytosine-5)-methyltransferase 1
MHCEIDPFCNKVMNHHFPNSYQHEDIRTTDFTIWRGRIDLITGGFPCQPYSTAGKRKGKADDRHLWPEMLRAIREVQPSWVVGENVRGLTNWDGGLVFDEVQADLEAEGYEVLPFLLPACAVNAPHRRDRIWFIAHRYDGFGKHAKGQIQTRRYAVDGLCRPPSNSKSCDRNIPTRPQDKQEEMDFNGDGRSRITTNAESFRKREPANEIDTFPESRETRVEFGGSDFGKFNKPNWEAFPTQSPLCHGNDGISTKLDGITFSRWRRESIKAAGNAIVPQIAFSLFKAIQQYTTL